MRDLLPKLFNCATEAVSDLSAVRIPIEPGEIVAAAAAMAVAELTSEGVRLARRNVRIVDCNERCTTFSNRIMHHLRTANI